MRKYKIHYGGSGAAIAVRLIFNKAANGIEAILPDGTLQVGLSCQKANPHVNQILVDYLATVINTSPQAIQIIAGADGDNKLLSIMNIDAEDVQSRVLPHVGKK